MIHAVVLSITGGHDIQRNHEHAGQEPNQIFSSPNNQGKKNHKEINNGLAGQETARKALEEHQRMRENIKEKFRHGISHSGKKTEDIIFRF